MTTGVSVEFERAAGRYESLAGFPSSQDKRSVVSPTLVVVRAKRHVFIEL